MVAGVGPGRVLGEVADAPLAERDQGIVAAADHQHVGPGRNALRQCRPHGLEGLAAPVLAGQQRIGLAGHGPGLGVDIDARDRELGHRGRCSTAEQFAVQPVVAIELLGEPEALGPAAPAFAEAPAQFAIVGQLDQGLGQRRRPAAANDQAAHAVGRVLGQAVGVRAHHGQPAGLGLEGGHAETLGHGVVQQHVGPQQGFAHLRAVAGALQGDDVAQVEVVDGVGDGLAVLAVAHDPVAALDPRVDQAADGFEAGLVALLAVKPPHAEDVEGPLAGAHHAGVGAGLRS